MDIRVEATTAIVRLLLPFPFISEGYSTSVQASPVVLSVGNPQPNIYSEIHTSVYVTPGVIKAFNPTPRAEVYSLRKPTIPRRMQHSAWQARLGNKLDPIKRKVLDNQILLTSHPTDMLRIRTNRDERSHDIISRTIISSEILPIILPIMKDVPLRRMQHVDGKTILSLSPLEDDKAFEAYCPMQGQLERDDLLFRILKDPYSDSPYFMVLQVKDELGTLSYSSLLYVKYKLSFYDEPLPEAITNKLYEFAKKRGELSW